MLLKISATDIVGFSLIVNWLLLFKKEQIGFNKKYNNGRYPVKKPHFSQILL